MTPSTSFTGFDGAGYERLMGRWSRRLADVFLDFVGTVDGELVLDVGCGTGSLAAGIAARTATTRVVGVDITPDYVDAARAAHPDPRLAFAVGDACALDCADASFDRVLSLLVLHFVPRTRDAVAEMRRVARPGAVVGAAVWDVRGGFVANRMFFDTAAALEARAIAHRARNYARPMTRPGELAAAWRAAGFVDVEETSIGIRMEFADFADWWTPYLGQEGPIAAYVRTLDEPARARLEAALLAAYLDGDPDGPRSFAALAWAVKGRAP